MGINRIVVVAGYRAGQVYKAVGHSAAVIHNEIWDASNSLYSLWLSRHWTSGPLLILNCDVLIHPEILARVLSENGDAFAYDSSSGHDDEHMKVRFEDQRLRAMSKCMEAHQAHGENVGMLYFNDDTVPLLYQKAESVLMSRGHDVWLAEAVQEVAQERRLQGIDVCDLPWVEIDYSEDLEFAEQTTWPAIQEQPWSPGFQEIGLDWTTNYNVAQLSASSRRINTPSVRIQSKAAA